MTTIIINYPASVAGLAGLATLILAQVIVATAAARKAGQIPGLPITLGHESFAFRAQRAHQNSLENALPFIAAVLAAMFAGATPALVEAGVLLFLTARIAHAAAYYLGFGTVRTAAFGVGLLALLMLLIATFRALVA